MKHKAFEEFNAVVIIAVHFADKMSTADISEVVNDWYILYKEMRYEEPIDFLTFHLPSAEVNRDTHDFWLDNRGLMILYLQTRVY